jgi:hypothetical protein
MTHNTTPTNQAAPSTISPVAPASAAQQLRDQARVLNDQISVHRG